MLLTQKLMGYVDIPNGKVDITDPCYNRSTWCRINDVTVKPGSYRCRYYMGAALEPYEIEEIKEACKDWGKTDKETEEFIEMDKKSIKGRCFVIELQLKGRAFKLNSPKWEEIGDIGVDAGLAGFFWNKPDFKDGEWSKFCDAMDSSKVAYLNKDMGFWVQSGYGDGFYNVYAIKEKDEIIALRICF